MRTTKYSCDVCGEEIPANSFVGADDPKFVELNGVKLSVAVKVKPTLNTYDICGHCVGDAMYAAYPLKTDETSKEVAVYEGKLTKGLIYQTAYKVLKANTVGLSSTRPTEVSVEDFIQGLANRITVGLFNASKGTT